MRSGAHSIPGFSTVDGGMVIDLSGMRGVRVDPNARRAVVQPGLLWQDFDAESQAFGLAATGGLISTTGVAGFTLGGGIGWLVRCQGLAADHLIGADVVTADGRIVHAGEHADEPSCSGACAAAAATSGSSPRWSSQLQPVGPLFVGGPVSSRATAPPRSRSSSPGGPPPGCPTSSPRS